MNNKRNNIRRNFDGTSRLQTNGCEKLCNNHFNNGCLCLLLECRNFQQENSAAENTAQMILCNENVNLSIEAEHFLDYVWNRFGFKVYRAVFRKVRQQLPHFVQARILDNFKRFVKFQRSPTQVFCQSYFTPPNINQQFSQPPYLRPYRTSPTTPQTFMGSPGNYHMYHDRRSWSPYRKNYYPHERRVAPYRRRSHLDDVYLPNYEDNEINGRNRRFHWKHPSQRPAGNSNTIMSPSKCRQRTLKQCGGGSVCFNKNHTTKQKQLCDPSNDEEVTNSNAINCDKKECVTTENDINATVNKTVELKPCEDGAIKTDSVKKEDNSFVVNKDDKNDIIECSNLEPKLKTDTISNITINKDSTMYMLISSDNIDSMSKSTVNEHSQTRESSNNSKDTNLNSSNANSMVHESKSEISHGHCNKSPITSTITIVDSDSEGSVFDDFITIDKIDTGRSYLSKFTDTTDYRVTDMDISPKKRKDIIKTTKCPMYFHVDSEKLFKQINNVFMEEQTSEKTIETNRRYRSKSLSLNGETRDAGCIFRSLSLNSVDKTKYQVSYNFDLKTNLLLLLNNETDKELNNCSGFNNILKVLRDNRNARSSATKNSNSISAETTDQNKCNNGSLENKEICNSAVNLNSTNINNTSTDGNCEENHCQGSINKENPLSHENEKNDGGITGIKIEGQIKNDISVEDTNSESVTQHSVETDNYVEEKIGENHFELINHTLLKGKEEKASDGNKSKRIYSAEDEIPAKKRCLENMSKFVQTQLDVLDSNNSCDEDKNQIELNLDTNHKHIKAKNEIGKNSFKNENTQSSQSGYKKCPEFANIEDELEFMLNGKAPSPIEEHLKSGKQQKTVESKIPNLPLKDNKRTIKPSQILNSTKDQTRQNVDPIDNSDENLVNTMEGKDINTHKKEKNVVHRKQICTKKASDEKDDKSVNVKKHSITVWKTTIREKLHSEDMAKQNALRIIKVGNSNVPIIDKSPSNSSTKKVESIKCYNNNNTTNPRKCGKEDVIKSGQANKQIKNEIPLIPIQSKRKHEANKIQKQNEKVVKCVNVRNQSLGKSLPKCLDRKSEKSQRPVENGKSTILKTNEYYERFKRMQYLFGSSDSESEIEEEKLQGNKEKNEKHRILDKKPPQMSQNSSNSSSNINSNMTENAKSQMSMMNKSKKPLENKMCQLIRTSSKSLDKRRLSLPVDDSQLTLDGVTEKTDSASKSCINSTAKRIEKKRRETLPANLIRGISKENKTYNGRPNYQQQKSISDDKIEISNNLANTNIIPNCKKTKIIEIRRRLTDPREAHEGYKNFRKKEEVKSVDKNHILRKHIGGKKSVGTSQPSSALKRCQEIKEDNLERNKDSINTAKKPKNTSKLQTITSRSNIIDCKLKKLCPVVILPRIDQINKDGKTDSVETSTISKVCVKVESMLKTGVQNVEETKLLQCSPLPKDNFPMMQRACCCLQENDCCDRAITLENIDCSSVINVIKQALELDDVIEIKPDIPIIDLTGDSTIEKIEKTESEEKVITKENISNIQTSYKADEMITLYRGEESVSNKLDVQVTSVSLSHTCLINQNDGQNISGSSTKLVADIQIGNVDTRNQCCENQMAGTTSYITPLDNITLNAASPTLNNPVTQDAQVGKEAFNTNQNSAPTFSNCAAVTSKQNADVSHSNNQNVVPTYSNFTITPIASAQILNPKNPVTSKPNLSKTATCPTYEVGNNTKEPICNKQNLEVSYSNNQNTAPNNYTAAPASLAQILNSKVVATGRPNLPKSATYSTCEMSTLQRNYVQNVPVPAESVKPNTVNSVIQLQQKIVNKNKSPARTPYKRKNSSQQKNILTVDSIVAKMLKNTDNTSNNSVVRNMPTNNTETPTESNYNSIHSPLRHSEAEGPAPLHEIGIEEIRKVGMILIKYLYFFDGLKKAQWAYNNELLRMQKLMPSFIRMESNQFDNYIVHKYQKICKELIRELKSLNPTARSNNLISTQMLMDCVFKAVQKMVDNLTVSWIYLMMEALMQQEIAEYMSVPFLRDLYNFVIFITGKIRNTHQASTQMQGTRFHSSQDLFTPHQRKLLEWQIKQYISICSVQIRQIDEAQSNIVHYQSRNTNARPLIQHNNSSENISNTENVSLGSSSCIQNSNLTIHQNIVIRPNNVANSVNQNILSNQISNINNRNPSCHYNDSFKIRLPYTTPRDISPPITANNTNSQRDQNVPFSNGETSRTNSINTETPYSDNLSSQREQNLSLPTSEMNPIKFTTTQVSSSVTSDNVNLQKDQNLLHSPDECPRVDSTNAQSTTSTNVGTSHCVKQAELKASQATNDDKPENHVETNSTSETTCVTVKKEKESSVFMDQEIEVIDLTWINDIDPEQLKTEMEYIAIKKEELPEKIEDTDQEEFNEEFFGVAPSPADSGISSPPIQIEYDEILLSNRSCICGRAAEYVCGCIMAMYCSVSCQLRHWKDHKDVCLKHKGKNNRDISQIQRQKS